MDHGRRARGAFGEFLADALALLFPVACAGCGLPDREVCPECARALAPEVVSLSGPDGLPIVAGARYEGVVRALLLAGKEGRTSALVALAPVLRAAVRACPSAPGAELCAVPATRASLRRRGFDPVRLLLARAGLRSARVLAPARAHSAQKALDRAARRDNAQGVYRARYPLVGRRFLLVDDIVTTGSTLAEVARAIREARGEVVGAVVVAATPRRQRHPKAPTWRIGKAE